jgi:maleylpyruvate isomerase
MNSLYVPRIDVATKKLLKTVSALDDAAAAGPSLLPDWDRSMVITHLAANADGVRRAVEAARRGDTAEVYPGGKAARDAEIEAGRALPAQELKARLEVACQELASALGEGTDEIWDSPAIGPRGEVHIGPGLVVSRLREVEVHHVDLDAGYKPEDWPFEWVMEEMDRAMLDLPSRLPPGEAVVLTATDADQHWVAGSGDATEVTGTTAELFAWVIGRASHVNGVECPNLVPWR